MAPPTIHCGSTRHAMPLSPGTRLGSYEILAPLGVGGMGEVYRARDTILKRDVALEGAACGLCPRPGAHGSLPA